MARKSDIFTAVILMARASDGGWLSGQTQRIGARQIAVTLAEVNRDATRLARLHLDECNGDHEKCQACEGNGARNGRPCSICKGTGRKTDKEIAKLISLRDRLEVKILHKLKSIGILASIERDPRGGPVRVYTDSTYQRRDESICVLPMEGR